MFWDDLPAWLAIFVTLLSSEILSHGGACELREKVSPPFSALENQKRSDSNVGHYSCMFWQDLPV